MAAVAFVLLVVLFVAATLVLFVWPDTDAPRSADAVVVFGAEVPARLEEGQRLVERGVAPILVLTVPVGWEEGSICDPAGPADVICVHPQPPTTRGDARAAATLAEERGWRSVALVTSDYHAFRARLLLERCYRGEVALIGAQEPDGLKRDLSRILHEWGGFAQALTWGHGC